MQPVRGLCSSLTWEQAKQILTVCVIVRIIRTPFCPTTDRLYTLHIFLVKPLYVVVGRLLSTIPDTNNGGGIIDYRETLPPSPLIPLG